MRRELYASAALLASVIALAGCSEGRTEERTAVPSATFSVQGVPPSATGTPRETGPPRVRVPGTLQAPAVPSPSVASTSPPPAVSPSTAASRAPAVPPTRPSASVPPSKPPKATAAPRTTVAPVKPVAPAPPGNTLRVGAWSHGYLSSYGSQKALDACHLVEWSPLWFAGHNYCGYQFWAYLGKEQTITLTGRNAGTYTVTDLVYLPYQGGKVPQFTQAFDLVLQTCKGSGTQLVLARRTGA